MSIYVARSLYIRMSIYVYFGQIFRCGADGSISYLLLE